MSSCRPRNLPSLEAAESARNVKVYAFNAGILKTQTQHMIKDTRIGTPFDIPIPFLVIKHGSEWLAFDTGCNGKVARDAIGYWGAETVQAFTPLIAPDQEFREAIKILGLRPCDFTALVCSHGHVDHAGAIDNFLGTDVPIYFQRAEMIEIRRGMDAPSMGAAYIPGDFEHLDELNIREVDGLFDIFGDKSIIAFPTPGHSPGHQSLYVKPAEGEAFIYCADALYTLENMKKFIPPAIAADIPRTMQNFHWFQLQEWTGIKIVPSHDPEYWTKHAWAPSELVP